jgi:hypothetical protein
VSETLVAMPPDEDPLVRQAARLQAVRGIGHIALCAIDPRHGRAFDSDLVSLNLIAVLNRDAVGDELLQGSISARDVTDRSKLVQIARRSADLAAEIENQSLPPGWTAHETILSRSYHFDADAVIVTVNKDFSDRNQMLIRIYGWGAWSGYEGNTPGHLPLAAAMHAAQSMRDDPAGYLSPWGQTRVAIAKREYLLHLPITVCESSEALAVSAARRRIRLVCPRGGPPLIRRH